MKRCTNTNRFNMVEIVIAMVIILVALIGVLGLLPSSIEANSDAINRSAAADAADQFLHYMTSRFEQDWNDTAALPDKKPTADSSKMLFSSEGFMINSALDIAFEAPSEIDAFDPVYHNTGIFQIRQKSTSNVSDFQGEIRAWKEVNFYTKEFTSPGTKVIRGRPPKANIPGAPANRFGGVLWSGNQLEINGNNMYMPDGGHTQADLKLVGSTGTYGVFTYVNSSSNGTDAETNQVAPQEAPKMSRSLAEYKAIAEARGTYFEEALELENGPTPDTIYLVKQAKTIPNGSVVFVASNNIIVKQKGFNRQLTLICTGDDVNFSCNDLTVSPAIDNVLIWCTGDVHFFGSGLNVKGIVRAHGDLHFNGTGGSVFDGSLWGDQLVKINGDSLSVTGTGGGSIECAPNMIVEFAPDHMSVTANSSSPIQTVKIQFCPDSEKASNTQEFTGLSGKTVSLWGTDDNEMRRITNVWVTSGTCATPTYSYPNDDLNCATAPKAGTPGDDYISQTAVCTINAEISWPLEVPYEKRTKVVYKREVAKTAEVKLVE